MPKIISQVREPVRRGGVERYLLVTLFCFAATVSLVRLFLEITGYPQIGGNTIHIAHVLWGGLILFAAALLPLIYANRWVYDFGAVSAGVGAGLFLDEVGKFITQSNDYFYPAAAPIIYVFFLLMVLLYFQVKQSNRRDPRSTFYRVLDAVEEVVDRDLDSRERARLEGDLVWIQERVKEPNLGDLSRALLKFIRTEDLEVVPTRRRLFERLWERWLTWEARFFPRSRMRALLAGGLLGLGVVAVLNLMRLLLGLGDQGQMAEFIAELVEGGKINTDLELLWYVGRAALEGTVGLMIILASLLMLLGFERFGGYAGYYGLLLALTAVNPLVFYFEQFSTILTAVIQFTLLLVLSRYRTRFLLQGERE